MPIFVWCLHIIDIHLIHVLVVDVEHVIIKVVVADEIIVIVVILLDLVGVPAAHLVLLLPPGPGHAGGGASLDSTAVSRYTRSVSNV